MLLSPLTSRRAAKTSARHLAERLAGLLRQAWRKVCPWDPGDIPELDALYAPHHRPPAVPRHRFGRRNGLDDDAQPAEAVVTKKQFSLVASSGLDPLSPSKRR